MSETVPLESVESERTCKLDKNTNSCTDPKSSIGNVETGRPNACADLTTVLRTHIGEIRKRTLVKGDAFVRPQLQSFCILDVKTTLSESDIPHRDKLERRLKVTDGENVEMKLGDATSTFAATLEKCILTMNENESAEFVFDREIIFSSVFLLLRDEIDDEISIKQLSDEASVTVCIRLKSFSTTRPTWTLTSEEKYNLSVSHKERGTDFFQAGQVEGAFCQYSLAIKYLISIPECSVAGEEGLMDDDVRAKRKLYRGLKSVCYLNLAACQSKAGNHAGVIDNCTRALQLNPSTVKGLYRRALAFKMRGKFEEARYDLNRALKLEPQNKALISALRSLSSSS